jgi:hypothetical protein
MWMTLNARLRPGIEAADTPTRSMTWSRHAPPAAASLVAEPSSAPTRSPYGATSTSIGVDPVDTPLPALVR